MNKLYATIVSAICCFLGTSCSPYNTEDLEETQGTSLTIQTRAGENTELVYPIQVYAFNKDGDCLQTQEIASAEETLEMALPEGLYRIVATAGNQEYLVEDNSSWDKSIALNAPFYAQHALMMGSSNIELTDTEAEVSIAMSYAVSALQFSLSEIPDSATAVKVHVTPVSSSTSFKKEYANDEQTATIPCSLQEDIWQTGTVYVFPTSSQQTVFSIEIIYPNTTFTYGYTYDEPLEANQPYVLNGSFKGGIEIGGDFTVEGWKPACNISFTFGNMVNESPEPEDPSPVEPENGSILVEELPEIKSIWNGCFVWQVNNELDGEADLVVIAPDQFLILASETTKTLAGYQFNNWTEWRTFTKEEAEQLRKEYDLVNLPELNDILEANGLDIFYYNDDDRYLCENGSYSFNFKDNGTISAVGKSKEYYLRLLKTVHVKVK